MSRSPALRYAILAGSHLLALVIGILIFRREVPAAPAATAKAETPAAAASPSHPSNSAAPTSGTPHVRAPLRSQASVHQVAWRALADQDLTRPERMKASAVILREWIASDWEAALDTVMQETPDDFELLGEFHDLFAREPEEIWPLIESKRYGVLSKSLLGHWQKSLARRDEASLRQLAESLPEPGKVAALEILAGRQPRAQ
ncbi:hypothetical protein [Haloferula sp. BvORR071]|uniref:hypothetical protein n=1 Tax=Haloferula sp. BvORR071 TaxID=1396141 RepID=UPI000551640B|nr:hypothetical protein [Haloferula sp. BvORR071]